MLATGKYIGAAAIKKDMRAMTAPEAPPLQIGHGHSNADLSAGKTAGYGTPWTANHTQKSCALAPLPMSAQGATPLVYKQGLQARLNELFANADYAGAAAVKEEMLAASAADQAPEVTALMAGPRAVRGLLAGVCRPRGHAVQVMMEDVQ